MVVVSAAPKGPADRCGKVAKFDTILEVDGKPAGSTIDEVLEFVRRIACQTDSRIPGKRAAARTGKEHRLNQVWKVVSAMRTRILRPSPVIRRRRRRTAAQTETYVVVLDRERLLFTTVAEAEKADADARVGSLHAEDASSAT